MTHTHHVDQVLAFWQLYKVESRYNEGPRDWENVFAIMWFRYIEFLFHISYYY